MHAFEYHQKVHVIDFFVYRKLAEAAEIGIQNKNVDELRSVLDKCRKDDKLLASKIKTSLAHLESDPLLTNLKSSGMKIRNAFFSSFF